jgi:hypothetical protein
MASDASTTLRDAAYVAVGFGLLAFQRAQVRRRALERALEAQGGAALDQVSRLATELEERVEPALDELEGRLPPPAQDLLRTARSAAREARGRLAG